MQLVSVKKKLANSQKQTPEAHTTKLEIIIRVIHMSPASIKLKHDNETKSKISITDVLF